MKENRKIHIIINIIALVLTVLSFLFLILNNSNLEMKKIFNISIAKVLLSALLIIVLKGLRLYIILFGNKIKIFEYIQLYAKTTIVNIILPMKLGELYRWYSIGEYINSYSESFIIVILDRFVDTWGLISVAIIFSVFLNVNMTSIYFIFATFLLIVIMGYSLFKPLFLYWNRFLVFNKSSEHTLQGLYFLNICNKAYIKVNKIAKGRFAILYIISLVAWAIELVGISIWFHMGELVTVSNYLRDIITGAYNIDNILFIYCILVLIIVIEVFVFVISKVKKEKK